MSADDPKRTSAPFGIRVKVATICCPSLGGDNEAARVHYAPWWRRGGMAAHGERGATPVIGYLDPRSPDAAENRLRGFHRGLKDAGYIEGENITIVYRWAEDRVDRLPLLAGELVSRSVAAIVAAGVPTASAAKAATTTIPIVVLVRYDPV